MKKLLAILLVFALLLGVGNVTALAWNNERIGPAIFTSDRNNLDRFFVTMTEDGWFSISNVRSSRVDVVIQNSRRQVLHEFSMFPSSTMRAVQLPAGEYILYMNVITGQGGYSFNFTVDEPRVSLSERLPVILGTVVGIALVAAVLGFVAWLIIRLVTNAINSL
ncbi:MAG: hypothetical protein FWB76_03895 [Oscillospiraceae bacterium]|nr:hypothetical protein [Oscillospiraceae bacterium]